MTTIVQDYSRAIFRKLPNTHLNYSEVVDYGEFAQFSATPSTPNLDLNSLCEHISEVVGMDGDVSVVETTRSILININK